MQTVRYLDRKLVRNILRHTETHNRLQEEGEMWRNRRMEERSYNDHGRRLPSDLRSRQDYKTMRRRINQIGDECEDSWMWSGRRNRDVFNAELGNNERWGHQGFMELYPDEFISKESMDEMSEDEVGAPAERSTKREHKRRGDNQQARHKPRKKTNNIPRSSPTATDSDATSSSGSDEGKITSSNRVAKHTPASHASGKSGRRQLRHRVRAPSLDRVGESHPKLKPVRGVFRRARISSEDAHDRRRHVHVKRHAHDKRHAPSGSGEHRKRASSHEKVHEVRKHREPPARADGAKRKQTSTESTDWSSWKRTHGKMEAIEGETRHQRRRRDEKAPPDGQSLDANGKMEVVRGEDPNGRETRRRDRRVEGKRRGETIKNHRRASESGSTRDRAAGDLLNEMKRARREESGDRTVKHAHRRRQHREDERGAGVRRDSKR